MSDNPNSTGDTIVGIGIGQTVILDLLMAEGILSPPTVYKHLDTELNRMRLMGLSAEMTKFTETLMQRITDAFPDLKAEI